MQKHPPEEKRGKIDVEKLDQEVPGFGWNAQEQGLALQMGRYLQAKRREIIYGMPDNSLHKLA
eukprot:762021-Hanusia_phi.AAC.3